jgi:hypothetical protein
MPLTAKRFRDNQRLQKAAENKPALKPGEKSEAVAILQVALADLGFALPVTFARCFPDGIYGTETAGAVRQFQAKHGLAVDGIAGRNTLAKLDSLLAAQPDVPPPPFPVPEPPFPPPPSRGFVPAPVGSPPTPPAPSQRSNLVVIPGSSTPQLIGRRSTNTCGDVTRDDFKFNDFPTPSVPSSPLNILQRSFDFLRTRSDAELEKLWRLSFKNIHQTGTLGQDMITRFLGGSGVTLVHAAGGTLSNMAQNTNTFKAAHLRAQAEIELLLRVQAVVSGTVDFRSLMLTVDIPFSTFSLDLTIPLAFRAMIGGIQGTQLFMSDFTVPPGSRTYTANLQYHICDNFGVGGADLYTPDLQAMWLLQHERAGHRPFVNQIVIEETTTGTF